MSAELQFPDGWLEDQKYSTQDDRQATEAKNEKIDRLRRFLAFRLALDYRLPSKARKEINFTRDDCIRFLNLAVHCFQQKDGRPALLNAETTAQCINYLAPQDMILTWPVTPLGSRHARIEVTDSVIESEIKAPSKALGIPCSVAIAMLRMSIVLIQVSMCLLLQDTGLNNMAGKIYMDKTIVLDAVLPASATGLRRTMFEHIEREQRRYFCALRSPIDYEISPFLRDRLTRQDRNGRTFFVRNRSVHEEPGSSERRPDSQHIPYFLKSARYSCETAIALARLLTPPSPDDSWARKICRSIAGEKDLFLGFVS